MGTSTATGVKAVVCFRRRPDLSVEEFLHHWQNTHADKVRRLPGLRRYVQNPALASTYRDGRQPDFDGVAETWFDSTDALRTVGRSAEYAAVMEDEANFLDADSRVELLCDEHVIKDGEPPPGALKFIAFINRDPSNDVDHFQTYWRTTHGPLAAKNPYIVRYVQNHVRRRAYDRGRNPAFDGAPMTWFADLDAMRASAETPELAATRADEANFMSNPGGHLPFLIGTELEIDLG